MLAEELIEKSICPRCKRPVGSHWTVNCKGEIVCWSNCDGQHPLYDGRF